MWGKQVRARSGSFFRHLLPAGAGYSGLISIVASINPCTKCMYQDLSRYSRMCRFGFFWATTFTAIGNR